MKKSKSDLVHLETIDNISRNIKKKREEQGLSQSHLSALSGIERSSIVKIEKMTHSNLTVKTLSRLATSLNTTIISLISTALTFATKCNLSHMF
jgi:transcriptional regulator with XRE-family HTH domain